VWSEDDENKGKALAFMLVKLLNDLALRAKKLQNIGPGLNIMKKYEKIRKAKKLRKYIENLAPGPKIASPTSRCSPVNFWRSTIMRNEFPAAGKPFQGDFRAQAMHYLRALAA